MIDINKLSPNVKSDLLKYFDGDETKVKALDEYDAFDAFLVWNGIIGYTGTIMKALDNIRRAAK